MMDCPKCDGTGGEGFGETCGWCVRGQVEAPRVITDDMVDIHEGIDAWHEGVGGQLELHEFLGLSWWDYRTWVHYGRLPEGCLWFDPDREGSDDQRNEHAPVG